MRQRVRSQPQRLAALLLSTLIAGWPLPAPAGGAPPTGAEPVDRPLDEARMARIVGGGGGGGGLPTLSFESQRTASVGVDTEVTYQFTSPDRGGNDTIRSSIRVSDLNGDPGDPGSYVVELAEAGQAPFLTSGPAEVVLVQDIDWGELETFHITVTEAGGPTPRDFLIEMGPRYTLDTSGNVPAGRTLSFDAGHDVVGYTQDRFDTWQLGVSGAAPDQRGASDVYLDETSIGGKNVVKVLATDRITVKASDTKQGDVSLDNSDFPSLVLDEAGDHLVVVSNSDPTGTNDGDYTLSVGPYEAKDQTGGCEALSPPPGFTTPATVIGASLRNTGDRDCYDFSLTSGVTDIDVTLTKDTSDDEGANGGNEIRVFKDGELVGAKTGSGSMTKTFAVDEEGAADYEIVINNLKDGAFDYDLDVLLVGACVGGACDLPFGGSVLLEDIPASPIPTFRDLVNSDLGDDIPADAVASFLFDKQSSGHFELDVQTATQAGPFATACAAVDNADFVLENCDLANENGLGRIAVTRTQGSGAKATVRMGPNLRAKPIGTIGFAALQMDELTGFGDEDYLSFTIPAGTHHLGIGFNDKGIGTGANVVSVISQDDFGDMLIGDPSVPVVVSYTGNGDGGAPAAPIAAGDYVLVVDNDGKGDGSYEVCIGPDPALSDEDGTLLEIEDTDPEPDGIGTLSCGDSDDWVVRSSGETRTVRILVDELDSIPGKISADLIKSCGSEELCSDQANASIELLVELAADTDYTLRVDNDRFGSGDYTVRIRNP